MKINNFLFFIIILSLVLIISGEFELFELSNSENYKYIRMTGYLLQSVFWILYLFKQYSELNKKN